MQTQNLKTALLLIKSRTVTATHLPIGHSFIPYDLLLHLFHKQSIGEPTTLKNLFASLPYSDMGSRYHFNRLISNGWIDLIQSETDLRVKTCHPTEKFKIRFEKIVNELEQPQ